MFRRHGNKDLVQTVGRSKADVITHSFSPMQDVFVSSNVASTSTASTSSQRGRKVQLTTTSDDVFVSSTHTSAVEGEEGERKDSLNELDAVERSGTLQHVRTHTSSRGSDIVHHCTNVLCITNY